MSRLIISFDTSGWSKPEWWRRWSTSLSASLFVKETVNAIGSNKQEHLHVWLPSRTKHSNQSVIHLFLLIKSRINVNRKNASSLFSWKIPNAPPIIAAGCIRNNTQKISEYLRSNWCTSCINYRAGILQVQRKHCMKTASLAKGTTCKQAGSDKKLGKNESPSNDSSVQNKLLWMGGCPLLTW